MIQITPKVGLVIRYGFLWGSEAMTGQEHGKDRPCMIVHVRTMENGITNVQVAAITHTQPQDTMRAVEIPRSTAGRVGLDHQQQWVITKELNGFAWPGTDIRPVRNNEWSYGMLPSRTTRQIVSNIVENYRERTLSVINRDSEKLLEKLRRGRNAARNQERDRDRER